MSSNSQRYDFSRFAYKKSNSQESSASNVTLIESDTDSDDLLCLSPPVRHKLTGKSRTTVTSPLTNGTSHTSTHKKDESSSPWLSKTTGPATPQQPPCSAKKKVIRTRKPGSENPEIASKISGLLRLFPSINRDKLKRGLEICEYDVKRCMKWVMSAEECNSSPEKNEIKSRKRSRESEDEISNESQNTTGTSTQETIIIGDADNTNQDPTGAASQETIIIGDIGRGSQDDVDLPTLSQENSVASQHSSATSISRADSDIPPPNKKARTIVVSDSEEEETVTEPSFHELNEKISYLSGYFPEFTDKALNLALKRQRYNIEKTVEALKAFGLPSTKNLGSIKAFQQTRKAKAELSGPSNSRDVVHTAASFSDKSQMSCSKQDSPKLGSPVSKMQRHRIKNMSDDEDYEEESDEEYDEKKEEGSKEPVLSFLNNAELAELKCVPGCSQKKAELLVNARPFTDFDHLETTIINTKTLNYQIIEGCKEIIHMREVIHRLMKRCENLSQEIEKITSTYDSTGNSNSVNSQWAAKQPTIISDDFKMKPYQMVGLSWLKLIHSKSVNGILADEMGLGKTIQTIAFLAHLKENNEQGPHCIIVPSSTIDNWLRELQLWCPSIGVLLYYGSQEERQQIRDQIASKTIDEFYVLLTTYNMATISPGDRLLFKNYQFNYAVFDEGHMLKNMSSQRYRNLMKIRAARRLLLTGTPLQNNLVELMSLLCFVMPELFEGKTQHLKTMFTTITGTKGESNSLYEKSVIARAKRIMQPFVLRRLKSEVLKQLPTKHDQVHHVDMIKEQQEFYDNLKKKFAAEMEKKAAAADTANSNSEARTKNGDSKNGKKENGSGLGGGASMVMRLRQAANHPLLLRRLYDEKTLRKMAKAILKEPSHYEAVEQFVFEDMEVMTDFELHKLCQEYKSLKNYQLQEDALTRSGKFQVLDKMLAEMKEKGDRVLIFSQFTSLLDILECYMFLRDHTYLRLDGSTPVADRQGLIDMFNEDKEIFIFMLSTKAGGMGINLTAANTVIIHDIDFNPYNDKQAEDRCHRVGQTTDVTVHRLITKGSVEEAILQCANKKLQLAQDLTQSSSHEATGDKDDMNEVLKAALKT